MDVVMIAQYFPPDFGGAARRAYNAAKGLSLQGSNVTVITAFPHYPHGHIPDTYKMKILTTEEIDGIKVIRTWIPSIEHSSNIKRVLLHISFIFSSMLGFFYVTKADIIFAMNPSFFCFFPALLYKLLLQKNIVRNVDDLWPETWYDLGIIKNRFVKKILDYVTKISYRVPSAIIPISHSYAKVIMTKYSIPKEKIEVIEHGVDVTKFYNLAAKQPIREHKNKVIMYSGALTIGYDFEVVIKSAKLLESEPVHFIIRGTGSFRSKVQELVQQYKPKNLEVRTNLLTIEELNNLMNEADIFLLPMNLTGFDAGLPTKVLEYQALGKPLVCVSSGEAADYILKTKSGLVSTTNEPEKLAQLIMQLVNDEHLAYTLGRNGFNSVKNLTLESIGARFMDIIRRYVDLT